MGGIRPKKHLGQHFLHDQNIAQKIVASLAANTGNVLEIGPGTGMLTRFLLKNDRLNYKGVEIDNDSIKYLRQHFPETEGRLIYGDFLALESGSFFNTPFSVIGNFPYNISSQIFFKVLENRNIIPEVVCMIQKEVAERIAAPPGTKTYGILSVLLQAWYDIEYLFTVNEQVFTPPPRVKSAVIQLVRNQQQSLNCDEDLFKTVVKTAFNQRRKTLRNALKSLTGGKDTSSMPFLDLRAERLRVTDFVLLTQSLQ